MTANGRQEILAIKIDPQVVDPDRFGEVHPEGRLRDSRVPLVAGDVPVQLVVRGEIAELAVGAITQHILLAAVLDVPVGAAGVDAHTVAQTLRVPGLGTAVAPHFEHRLFLSATPHNGYRESFTSLLELLDNQGRVSERYYDAATGEPLRNFGD